ncbi:2-dehydropantoate 2-reductase [Streptomyces sp. NPDC013455]|uniref:2-dehydropantoate 2-reductase n=1 Tax=Streptomyces sp. NPDC013455 TaxID=3155605 RepID=UPI0033DA1BF4
MKAAVVGAGGLGGYFGSRLVAAGHDVRFVARGAHLEALRKDGLTVRDPDGTVSVTPVDATGDTREAGPCDLVLLAVKTWQLGPAIEALPPLLGPDTAVVTLQNGVEAPEQVAGAVGRAAVLPGVAKVIAQLDGPGRIRHVGGAGSLVVGEWDGTGTERVRRLRAALEDAAVPSPAVTDIWAELWAKFLFVVPFGSLGAAADGGFGELRSRAGTRRLLADAMREVERLAHAAGVALPADIVDTTLDFVDRQPAAGTSSLQRDLLAGTPSELDAWTGSVVRLGARHGVPTPIHSLLYEVLGVREDRAAAGAARPATGTGR